MRIGIDVSLCVGETAGVGRYAGELVKALAGIDQTNQYTLFPLFLYIRHPHFRTYQGPRTGNFTIWGRGFSERRALEFWRDPKGCAAFLAEFDVVHSTTFCGPPLPHPGWISTIYDLSFLTHPDCHLEANRVHCLRETVDSVLQASRLVAISEHTRQDLCRYLNAGSDRVIVTPLGCSEVFFREPDPKDRQRVREKYGLSRSFVLTLGSLEPRKNVAGLLRAWARLPPTLRREYDLVVAGGKGWLNSPIIQLVDELQIQDEVRFVGYAAEEDLPSLYQTATLFAYPSLYEGFGLPALEAMAGGTPVVTSGISPLRELAQGAAFLVDPSSPADIASALTRLLDDPKERARLAEAGKARASEYTWPQTASATLEVYRSAAGGHRVLDHRAERA